MVVCLYNVKCVMLCRVVFLATNPPSTFNIDGLTSVCGSWVVACPG